MKVVVGLSGGVDSAVAAARLRDEGHDVLGVHLELTPRLAGTASLDSTTLSDSTIPSAAAEGAAQVADALQVPLEVWDLREDFEREVVGPFVAEYRAGRTPNPCLRCNERIKFAALIRAALARGYDAVGSGHYARLRHRPGAPADEPPELHRGLDSTKDQSYVLAVLGPDLLARCRFPLGDSTKTQVRAEAAARGLPVAAQRDSFDVCFIPDRDVRGFLASRAEIDPGPIRDLEGQVVGQHPGALGFTVGQRKGLALRRPAPDGRPRYVVAVHPQDNTLVVGPPEALLKSRLTGLRVCWCGPPARPGQHVGVQVRAHGEELPARIVQAPEQAGAGGVPLVVELERPARAVACGQTMVLYDGTRVVGSATIDTAE